MQNVSYFNKEKIFTIWAIKTVDKIKYYWLKNAEINRRVSERFMRTELFALKINFFSLKTCIYNAFVNF